MKLPPYRPRGSRDLRGRCRRSFFDAACKQARAAFGRALRRTRLELGVAASELAAAIGVSRQHVHRIEAGLVDCVPLARMYQCAYALNVPPEHLLR